MPWKRDELRTQMVQLQKLCHYPQCYPASQQLIQNGIIPSCSFLSFASCLVLYTHCLMESVNCHKNSMEYQSMLLQHRSRDVPQSPEIRQLGWQKTFHYTWLQVAFSLLLRPPSVCSRKQQHKMQPCQLLGDTWVA